jgi:hypothetical protein
MKSWKVSELASVVVDECDGATARVSIIDADGRSAYPPSRIFGAARLELGGDRWQVGDLLGFRLLAIPPEPEPAPEPVSSTFRVRAVNPPQRERVGRHPRPDRLATDTSASEHFGRKGWCFRSGSTVSGSLAL